MRVEGLNDGHAYYIRRLLAPSRGMKKNAMVTRVLAL